MGWPVRVPSHLLVILLWNVLSTHGQYYDHYALNISRRESAIIRAIETHAASISVENFYRDPIILQTHSTVHYVSREKQQRIFSKKNPDQGKDSILLSSADNKWAIPTPRGAKKRQFVLLKKSPNHETKQADTTPYYMSFVFVRPTMEKEGNSTMQVLTHTEGNFIAEYDIWDQRPTKFYAGWFNCDFTALFTCTSVKAIRDDAIAKASKRRKRQVGPVDLEHEFEHDDIYNRHFLAKRDSVPEGPKAKLPPKLIPIQGAPGHDPGTYNDLYLDFDFHRFWEILLQHKKVDDVIEDKDKDDAGGPPKKREKRWGKKKGEASGQTKSISTGKAKGKGQLLSGLFGGLGAKAEVGASGGGGGGGGAGGMLSGLLGGGGGGGGGAGGMLSGLLGGGGGGGLLSGITGGLGLGGEGGGGLLSGITGGLGGEGGAGGLLSGVLGGGEGGGLLSGLTGGLGLGGEGGLLGGLGDGLLGGIAKSAGDLVGGLGDAVSSAAMDAAGTVMNTVVGEGGLADTLGQITAPILSPILDTVGATGLLDPLQDILTLGNDIIQELPGQVLGLGHELMGGIIAPISDALGVSDLIEGLGLGGIAEAAYGVADSILSTGEKLLSTWDTVGNALIDSAAMGLVKLGIPPDWAKLAALGAQGVFNTDTIKAKGFWLGWRLGVDAAGAFLNGGKFRGQGFDDDGSIPPNSEIIFGILYWGCDGGRRFFFAEEVLIYVVIIFEGSVQIGGWFKPAHPGVLDGFYPDDEAAAQPYINQRGVVIPKGYTPPPESGAGILGYYRPGYMFECESEKMKAVYDPTEPGWNEQIWMPPNIVGKLSPHRPKYTDDGRKILYGYLFPGMELSPHIFIAEGDSVSGFFVPHDKYHPEIRDLPHGVFTPSHPAGHGTFVADNPNEVANIKECLGAFVPDAMELAGGISGKISVTEYSSTKYSFVLDRPALDFVYVPYSDEVKNIWCPYLSPDEWKYAPPAMSTGVTEKYVDPPAPPPKLREKRSYGTKVTTKKSIVFFPSDYKTEGHLLFLEQGKRVAPVQVVFWISKPDEPWDVQLLQVQASLVAQGMEDPTPYIRDNAPCIIIPKTFPKDDALVGHFSPDATSKAGKFKPTHPTAGHFFTAGDDLWIPDGWEFDPEYKPIRATVGGGSDASANAPQAGLNLGLNNLVPGVVNSVIEPPKPSKNYRFGPKYNAEDPDLNQGLGGAHNAGAGKPGATASASPSSDPGRTRTTVTEGPNEYTHGFYIKSPESPDPIFVPETGAKGIFQPDGGSPAEGIYFPPRPNLPAKFMFEGNALPPGTQGKFYTIDKAGQRSKGFFFSSIGDTTLVPAGEEPEIIPGWQQWQATTVNVSHIPPSYQDSVHAGYVEPQMKAGTFAVVDVGGGFKGVVVDGPESAVDDPNNPLFQEYLHYRAQKEGDVSPWGEVKILDVMSRENAGGSAGMQAGGSQVLPKAQMVATAGKPGTMANKLMADFRTKNWEYSQAYQTEDTQYETLKFGTTGNCANMMDYRMWLMNKYTLKRTNLKGRQVSIYVSKAAETYLTTKSKAKVTGAVNVGVGANAGYVTEDGASRFASTYGVQPEDVERFDQSAKSGARAGAGVNFGVNLGKRRRKRQAKAQNWCDETTCDEIVLDDLQAAQASATMSGHENGPTGLDLGYDMVQGQGSDVPFTEIAQRVLARFDTKRAEAKKKKDEGNSGPSTTDLLGQASMGMEAAVKKDGQQGGGLAMEKGRSFELNADGTHSHASIVPGWKTQYRTLTPNATLSANGVIYYGLGNCELKETPDRKQWSASEPDKLVEYYLQVMRVHCMENAKERVFNLMNEGYLKIDKGDKFFEIPSDSKLLKSIRLTPTELKKLSVAFEFHAFTHTYCWVRENGYLPEGILEEPFTNITRSTAFLTELSFYIIAESRKIIPYHGIRMIRNQLATLRTVLTKLHQDSIALEECKSCEFDRMLTAGDKFRIVSLIQFIIHGLGPFETKEQELKPSFKQFVEINEPALRQRVEEFQRQFPKRRKQDPAGFNG